MALRFRVLHYVFIFSLLFSIPAFADRVADLYNFTVSVESQSRSDIEKASRQALSAVLIRVSGLPTLPASSGLRDASRNVQSLVLQSAVAGTEDNPDGGTKTLMTIFFDPTKIHQLLRSLELPLWPANRPSVLLFGVIDEGYRRFVLSASSGNELNTKVQLRAEQRGLPLVLPLSDLVDKHRVNIPSVVGGFWKELKSASMRYSTDATAVVLVQPHVLGRYRTKTVLWIGTEELSWVHDSRSIDDAVTDLVDRIVDLFVSQYGVYGTASHDITLTVNGITTLRQYRNLSTYLQRWEFIEAVNVERIESDQFTMRVRTSSSLEQLITHFSSEGQLQVDSESPNESEFTWVGSSQ